MLLSCLLVSLKSFCSRIPLAHKTLVRNASTAIKPHQTSSLCRGSMNEMEPNGISRSEDTRAVVSHPEGSHPKSDQEDAASPSPIGLGRASKPEKETRGREPVGTRAPNKSGVKQESRKRGRRADGEQGAGKSKKKKPIQRPNYFVSIPITDAQIGSAVSEVQEAVLRREPRLAKAMIPIPTLHLTLLVTHLADREQVDLAAATLAQAEPSLAELLGGARLVLPFSGVAHFRNDVVFVALGPGPHTDVLRSLAELLRARLEERGLAEGDVARGFQPHLTIFKLSRAPKLRSQSTVVFFPKGIKHVDPSLYSAYACRFFGDQTVERLDLCSMLKTKQQDGYYHTETSLQLGSRRRCEPDEAELLRISKRLVEDAVSRAVQQYQRETLQNGGQPNAGRPPGNADRSAETKTTDVRE
ncbi:A-kinase anchor protein 7-like isoform X1 [Syngnathus typhle]|uniref:A-kinase anchor protein 7-like isoform X1 n=1 Tax=Syngnathus typhle TaxID=161592 RepID=UPI002A6B1E3C|nr:A-kinase anchor protein 7-like isoform X1 [Syngnathus typhle]